MSRKTTLLAPLAFGFALLAATDALAWAPLDNAYPVWPNLPVTYKINQSTIPASISGVAVTRLDQGFADWGGEACTTFSATNLGNTASKYNSNDNQNILHWISASWPGSLGDVNSVIGVTPVVFSGSTIYDADIVFNDVGFCWNDSGNSGCVDTKSISTHEEGHFLGLGHSNVNGATMEPYYGGGGSQGSLAQDDKDGVCALYPVGGSSAASSSSGGSTCDTCVNNSSSGNCQGAYDACGASQDCIDFYYCLYDCADQACVDNCVATYPSGAQIYVDLIDCVCADCSAECSAECGGSSSSSATTSGNTTSTTAATTGSGETTAASTGSGAGGSGATGAGGGDAATTTSTGSGGKKKKNNADSTEVGGCAVGGSSGGSATLAAVLGLGLAFASRRRRARR